MGFFNNIDNYIIMNASIILESLLYINHLK